MRIVICEDNAQDLAGLMALIRRYHQETGQQALCDHYAHTDALLADPAVLASDLLLLDIMMEQTHGAYPSGILAARELRARGYDKALCFVTSSQAYYPQGFEVGALHYLVKPPRYDDFAEMMRWVAASLPKPDRLIRLPVKSATIEVSQKKLVYVEVYGRETLVHTTTETLRVHLPLHKVIELLGGDPFLQCFRSYVINMDHVARVEESHFVLQNGQRIPIAVRNRHPIKTYYLRYHLGPLHQEAGHE